jgi:hypothetical protein
MTRDRGAAEEEEVEEEGESMLWSARRDVEEASEWELKCDLDAADDDFALAEMREL